MKEYILTAEVVEPICLAKRQEAGNIYETLDYIPGRLIWGALASLTGIRPGKKPGDEFLEVFFSDNVIFSNLYPTDETKAFRSKPIPLSARALKEAPGFKEDELPDLPGRYGKGIWDWLMDGIPEDVVKEEYEKYPGFYIYDPPNCKKVSIPKFYLTQHERDSVRGVSKEGRLFVRELFQRGEAFLGFIRSISADGDKVLEWLFGEIGSKAGINLEIPIGRSPGRINLTVEDAMSCSKHPLYKELSTLNSDGIFTITCVSDTIVLDQFLRPLKYVPKDLVLRELYGVIKTCEVIRHFSAAEVIRGWSGVYQRPCEDEVAIAKGSAFLFKYGLGDGKKSEDLIRTLNELQKRGLGLRKAEGFGEISINDTFHHEYKRCPEEGR
ncbi:hypothetical protein [Candidatus Hakubella thermalkaliphila]|uniref:CRISPR-associated RAMP protein Csx10 n=2 Tax=Candidatus Hakubella thermalkaliphila TaxID=2754717 RepID=A0A6V8Q5R9_9ACTN|nr:hypothetical protein [Candidatus Hakubella thermalkaliphila]MBT9167071.1 hypothetical protein [Bacillota bacterium]GFP30900.1 hypothetical protein HKBW3S34_01819 [Candidatus Hakubella thermalkaliphila]GFP39434.1 hypothetical protein HKBW3S47_01133 [Candidatus Hakubella thermalkaliphila]GFP43058.1 hypothetical protein HKBW3C_02190 [Candidatus Hakubella thermalkaliphila]